MKIIEPSVVLIRPIDNEEGIKALRFIEGMARISHRAESRQNDDTWAGFITSVVMKHGDWSVTEHSTATAIFRVNRGVTHELVRHRLFSFTQESTRFVNGRKSYPEGLEFVPSQGRVNDLTMLASFEAAEKCYLNLLDSGVRPQEARSVLPNALAATISVTGNFRSWRWLLLARTTLETHPDFRAVTIPLLRMFQDRVPILFDDIEPLQKQSVAMGKVH